MATKQQEKEWAKRYREKHQEEIYNYNSVYYRKNIEKRKAYNKAYYAANRELILERTRKSKEKSLGGMYELKDKSLLILFGEKIQNLRLSFGDSAYTLAHELGIQVNSLDRMENGFVEKVLLYIPAIINYYGITIEQFINEY